METLGELMQGQKPGVGDHLGGVQVFVGTLDTVETFCNWSRKL